MSHAVHPVTLEVVRHALYAIADASEGGGAPLSNLPPNPIARATPCRR